MQMQMQMGRRSQNCFLAEHCRRLLIIAKEALEKNDDDLENDNIGSAKMNEIMQ